MSSAIFEQVVEATRGEYVLHGTLGHSDALGSAFLAREVATGRSVLLAVPPDAESLDVVGALSDTIPADAGACAACGFRVATWSDACPRCEHALLPPSGASPDAAVLREQLRDSLHVVGSLPHVRGGTMYFGEEAGDRRLIAFVVRPEPDGQLALDVVWERVGDAPAAAAPAGLASSASEPGARTPTVDDVAWQPVAASAGVDSTAYRDRSDAVVPPRTDDDRGDQADARPARRHWLPIGIGVGVLAAVAGVAFALTRHTAPVRVPPPITDAPPPLLDTSLTGHRTATSSPAESSGAGLTVAGNATSVPLTVNDSIRRIRRHVRDSLRAARAQDQNSAVLTIEGDLPTGWVQTVNGAAPSSARDVPLVVGTPTVIRIEAPGYCADTLSLTPAARSHQRWAPTLRGRPTVGEC